jgi:hypothetical protein
VSTGGTLGTGGSVGTGGKSTATGGSGGGGGKSTATGGAGGSGGAAGGSSGASTGGTSGGAESCDWAGCAQQQCAVACPTGMGDYCAMTCSAIITCIRTHPTCGTEADPMCVKRAAGTGTANTCTSQWESGSGSASPPGAPAQAAINYFKCACGVSVGTGGASGTGGKSGTGGSGGKAGTGGAGGSGGKGN